MSHHASTSNNNDKAEPLTKEEWQSRLESFEFKQADMNKLIMNYLVTGKNLVNEMSIFDHKLLSVGFFSHMISIFSLEGFKEAAEKFQAEAGVEPSVPLNSLDNRILIREAVQSGRIQEATHLVNKLHPWLLDNDRYLYFHLQQLHLIELIRFVLLKLIISKVKKPIFITFSLNISISVCLTWPIVEMGKSKKR